jgi:2-polyprenyl-3-methyl-5-hydroxy-6-metoxy-1,4-benzoquinol methylase
MVHRTAQLNNAMSLKMDPYQELTLYQKSAVLMAAAKLGVFEALENGASTAPEIANRIKAPVDTVQRLLAALASLEYLRGEGENFALNDFSKAFTHDGAGGMQRLAWKEHLFYVAWGRLADSIFSGEAIFPGYADRLERDFAQVKKFLLALNDLAELAAPGVIGTGAFANAATILDLGGGGGGYAAELARALPEPRITLADLPSILPIARGHLQRKGLNDRVEFAAADFAMDACGLHARTFDCVLLSHILHDFDAEQAAAIVSRAGGLVKPGGKLIILDVLVSENGHSNPVEALFDLMMLVEVPRGRTHKLADVAKWIQSAGMSVIKTHKLYFGTLLEAIKQ